MQIDWIVGFLHQKHTKRPCRVPLMEERISLAQFCQAIMATAWFLSSVLSMSNPERK